MRLRLMSLLVALAVAPAALAADGPSAAQRIDTDAEIRRILQPNGVAAAERARQDRFAARIDHNLDRARVRIGTLPSSAQRELRHARRDLNTLKTRAPNHPGIPLLERELTRVTRQAR